MEEECWCESGNVWYEEVYSVSESMGDVVWMDEYGVVCKEGSFLRKWGGGYGKTAECEFFRFLMWRGWTLFFSSENIIIIIIISISIIFL